MSRDIDKKANGGLFSLKKDKIELSEFKINPEVKDSIQAFPEMLESCAKKRWINDAKT